MPVEIALQQRDAGAFHRDVGARSHGDADFGRRERRRIVDAVAGHRDDPPGLLQLCDHRALLVGQHFGLDVGDAKAARDGLRRGPVVAGQHDDVDALRRQRLQRLRRRRLHRVGDGEHSRQLAVDGDEDRQSRRRRADARPARSSDAVSMPSDCRKSALPSTMRLAVDLADRALAGRRVEFLDLAEIEIALLGRPHDGVGQRMLARPLDARGQPQNIGLVKSRRPARWRPPSACPPSAFPSCRPPACRPSPCAPALRRS